MRLVETKRHFGFIPAVIVFLGWRPTDHPLRPRLLIGLS
jgi:hypothetical protein